MNGDLRSADNWDAVGLAAFGSLRAEAEPWLERCLILPPFFDLLLGARSHLVYGDAGSGKTALFQALAARLTADRGQEEPPPHLVVRWRPRSLEPGVVGSAAAAAQLEHSLGECMDVVLDYVRCWPQGFRKAHESVRRSLAWFVYRYLGTKATQRIQTCAADAREEAAAAMNFLLTCERKDEWLSAADPKELIAELIKALRVIGPQVVHILVSPDDLGEPEEIERSLRAFLSAPALFENWSFAYKMILPAELGAALASSGAVNRRRAEVHRLSWHTEDLVDLVVQRTALAVGQPLSGLADICEDAQLEEWLERTGGDSPRGWLQYVTPVVTQYLRRQRPISTKEWRAIRSQAPPPLSFDEETGSVTVGRRWVEDLTEGQLALLEYLYRHRGRVCSRQELYYQAYQPLSHLDDAVPTAKEFPKDYNHILDSVISRLRQAIEPDPEARIYLTTVRGKGYKLEHTC